MRKKSIIFSIYSLRCVLLQFSVGNALILLVYQYVTEVRLPQNHKASPSNASLTDIVKEVETTDLDENMQASSDEEDSGWVSTQDSASAVESQPSQSTHPPSLPLANGPAELAANVSATVTQTHHLLKNLRDQYLLRILPYPQPAPPPVTLSRLRLTAYRFYFAIVPAYVPLFSSLLKLATWQHEGTSLFYCAVSINTLITLGNGLT